MTDVYVVGTASTPFAKHPERDFRALAEDVVHAALEDAGLESGAEVDQAWFGNCAMGQWGQDNIRGQVALTGLMRDGTLPARLPIINVEAGCATGSAAFHSAFKDIASGTAAVSLALGIEKTWIPDDPMKTFALFAGGIDQRHRAEWKAFFAQQGDRHGVGWAPDPRRILFLDVHAMQARYHMDRYGTTPEQLAAVASKNHHHGALNPKAQYRFEIDVQGVLDDRFVVDPLTRAMCAPISDGAAATLLCSGAWLKLQPQAVQDRAIKVRASTLTGGTWRELDEDNVVTVAARRAYAVAGLGPEDVDLAEVHDATAYCELQATEALGFCDVGEGGAYAESGATTLGGERPVNLSGGLESKGHPLGATGLGMIDELVTQLRGEAGDRQAPGDPTIAVQQNAGGLIGLDEALCGVNVLERVR
jgi:acetyl-CoA acetyltransferase